MEDRRLARQASEDTRRIDGAGSGGADDPQTVRMNGLNRGGYEGFRDIGGEDSGRSEGGEEDERGGTLNTLNDEVRGVEGGRNAGGRDAGMGEGGEDEGGAGDDDPA